MNCISHPAAPQPTLLEQALSAALQTAVPDNPVVPSSAVEERDCKVYAIHMKPSAWGIPALRNANPRFDFYRRSTTEPIYVGETRKSIEERYRVHRTEGLRASTKWGRRHFKDSFREAYDRSIRKLRKEYGKERNVDLDALTRPEARYHEKHFALWLRQRGYAVYFA